MARLTSTRPTASSTPKASSYIAQRTMEANRSKDTAPEVLLRSALHRSGLRFRKQMRVTVAGVTVRIDVAFPGQRVAVFTDGCFWHGCPEHLTWPKANADWWRAKIEGNRARDRRVDEALAAAGWEVVRIWEHENPVEVAQRINRLVWELRSQPHTGDVTSPQSGALRLSKRRL